MHDKLCVRLISPSATIIETFGWKEGEISREFQLFSPRESSEPRFWCCDYVGGTLFLLGGGDNVLISDVCQIQYPIFEKYGYDTDKPRRIPRSIPHNFPCSVPPMRTRRCQPLTAVVGGKLFVLGDNWGFCKTESFHWGEVYDPSHGAWHPLDCPWDSPEVDDYMMIAVLQDEKILASFSSSHVIYAYDLKIQTWDQYHILDQPLEFRGRGFVVDNVIYCTAMGCLCAYDMTTRQQLSIPFAKILWKTSDLPPNKIPFLQHMGGNNFCIAWNIVDGQLRILHFTVSISVNLNQERYLHTSINYTNLYDLGMAGGELVNLVTLDDSDLDRGSTATVFGRHQATSS